MSIQTKEIKKMGEAVPHWVACVTSEGAKIFRKKTWDIRILWLPFTRSRPFRKLLNNAQSIASDELEILESVMI
jgi:lysophospholipid acyltransferase (LPLAT)-like uncharacterized protein